LSTSMRGRWDGALGVRYVNRDPQERYTLTKEIICDPHHSVVLVSVRLEGDEELLGG